MSLLPLFSKVLERVVFITLYQHVKPALSEAAWIYAETILFH